MLRFFMVMDRRKALALVGKSVKESSKFGRMIPNLDGEYSPQLMVKSGMFDDIEYLVRPEFDVLKMYVFMNIDGWKAIPASSFDRILYQGFPEEYNELADIVKSVNDEIKKVVE